MAMPENISLSEHGEQVSRCPLEDFSELWSINQHGVQVIPCRVIKALITRNDGGAIKYQGEIFRITRDLKQQGVTLKAGNRMFWDIDFVRGFYAQMKKNENEFGVRYRMAGVEEVGLETLIKLKEEVRLTCQKTVIKPKRIKETGVVDSGEEDSPVNLLISLGRQKSFVTLDDVLLFFPEAEQDAGQGEPSEEELAVAEEAEPELLLDDYLANIDTDDTIGLYLKEVSRTPLLTATEEVQLAQRIEQGRAAREELARGKVSPRRRMNLRSVIEDGWSAREHLITANARLVISVAKKYIGRGVPFLDLIQEGNIGLIRASKKFDYRRGHKFSTYATWWIRQAVTRAIADQGRTIRVPVHMGDQINRMLRAQHQLTQKLGRDPSVEELSDALEISTKKVENMIQAARRPLSLETPTDDEKDSVLGDFVKDDEVAPPDDIATYNLLREKISEVFNVLPPREVHVLRLRYGLLDGQAYTLEEVGRKMGVTRERVRQIEAQALSRLRHPNVSWKLRDYLEE